MGSEMCIRDSIGAIQSKRWQNADEPLAYLHASMVNNAKMSHRSSSRRRDREWRVSMAIAAAPQQQRLLDRPEVVEAIRSLSAQQRAVVYFTYWEDQRPIDIARTLNVEEGTVKKQLARARARLREVLEHG